MLAVHVEDHPLDYADFEGEIPAGQYGAGTVELWDRGTYELVEEKRDGGLTVHLHGERLEGLWTLVPAKLDGDPKNWLLIRKHGGSEPPAERQEYRPMLATPADEPPAGRGVAVRGQVGRLPRARPRPRRRGDAHEPQRQRPHGALRGGGARAPRGAAHLRLRARRRGVRARRARPAELLGDAAGDRARSSTTCSTCSSSRVEPLVGLPLSERRERLEALLDANATVKLSAAFDDGEALLAAATKQGLEGILAKRADSRYTGAAQPRVAEDQDRAAAGVRRRGLHARPRPPRRARSARSCSASTGAATLVYVGNVGTGFSDAELDRLLALLRPLERPETPFEAVPKLPRVRRGDVVWVEPVLVRRGSVRRVDARPPPPCAALPRAPRGQGGG